MTDTHTPPALDPVPEPVIKGFSFDEAVAVYFYLGSRGRLADNEARLRDEAWAIIVDVAQTALLTKAVVPDAPAVRAVVPPIIMPLRQWEPQMPQDQSREHVR